MFLKTLGIFLLFLCSFAVVKAQDPLAQYITRLRQSEASGGSETAFLSVGSTFLYGQGYFEKKQYDLAHMYFKQAYEKDSTNAFVNYQLAASLLKQNNQYKAEEAKIYLQNAIRLNPDLAARAAKEFPSQPNNANPGNNAPVGGLTNYIEALKYSQANGGAKTAMNSPGLDVLYGYEYYEKGNYEFAAMRFRQAVTKDPDDAYANYLLAVSLTAQGLLNEAKPYLEKAFAGDASLKKQFVIDSAKATAESKKHQAKKEPKPVPNNTRVGGKLTYGNYVCTETIWRGANTNGGYVPPAQKGYFALKADGTYRWLDNGETGRYTYDEKTGAIKFTSGYFANAGVKTSSFQPGVNVSQITVNFSSSYRWECGCKK